MLVGRLAETSIDQSIHTGVTGSLPFLLSFQFKEAVIQLLQPFTYKNIILHGMAPIIEPSATLSDVQQTAFTVIVFVSSSGRWSNSVSYFMNKTRTKQMTRWLFYRLEQIEVVTDQLVILFK